MNSEDVERLHSLIAKECNNEFEKLENERDSEFKKLDHENAKQINELLVRYPNCGYFFDPVFDVTREDKYDDEQINIKKTYDTKTRALDEKTKNEINELYYEYELHRTESEIHPFAPWLFLVGFVLFVRSLAGG